jgi:L-histidine N-alpha-methyltransferase
MQRNLAMQAEEMSWGMTVGSQDVEILSGLMADPMYVPSKFFYDEAGSKLFEQITRLDEYYPSRTEKWILKLHAAELMEGADDASLVELGSGDCSKISILLTTLPRETLETLTYIPFDVSKSAINDSGCKLRERFGIIEISGIVADFMQHLDLVSPYENRVFCFFGSTIGNLDRRDAIQLLKKLGKLMRKGERLLLGLDMVKDKDVLEKAYNDEEGVTARFNKNVLNVANNKIGTDFNLEDFKHYAFFDEAKQRIEMHLVARKDMTVTSPFFDGALEIRKGESIHTENSHKFTTDHIDEIASNSRLSVRQMYADSNSWFTLVDYIK